VRESRSIEQGCIESSRIAAEEQHIFSQALHNQRLIKLTIYSLEIGSVSVRGQLHTMGKP
jgi:hypothetical protein